MNAKVIVSLVVLGTLGTAVVLHAPFFRESHEDMLGAVHGGVHGTATETVTDVQSTIRARDGVAAIGRNWDAAAFEETVRLYTDVHREIEWPGQLAPEAFPYGSHPQQTLTLFRPEQGFSEPSFVLLFLHGNGLDESDQTVPGSQGLIYSHVGKVAAHFGGIGITADYRTGGGATEQTGAEDLRLMLQWARENVARYGGDPDTIVLVANSRGATHAASYLFDESAQLEAGPGLAAVVLASGLFGELAPRLDSLIDGYGGPRVPLALWSGEYDIDAVEDGIDALHAQLCEKYGECPSRVRLAGHNHVSHIMSLGTADTQARDAFIRFYHTVR